jgi:hypothetical protein
VDRFVQVACQIWKEHLNTVFKNNNRLHDNGAPPCPRLANALCSGLLEKVKSHGLFADEATVKASFAAKLAKKQKKVSHA